MSESPTVSAPATRISFERLRERTDELELIISGLSLFALLSLPSWLYGHYLDYATRLSLGASAAIVIALPVIGSICYTMAVLFLLHLAVRAHWVGLIGLKSAFPDGVRWERLRGVGPLTQARLQRRLPSIDDAIAAADRTASVLFSLITFTAQCLGILGVWMILLFVAGGLFGHRFGGTNHFINASISVLFNVLVGAPLLLWLLDGVLARRWAWLRERRLFAAVLAPLRGVEGLFFPRRLVGPTRYTLQSHTLPRLFFPLFVAGLLAVAFFGSRSFQQFRNFDVLGSQQFVTTRDLVAGQRSGSYESQRTSLDKLRPGPMIPAPVIATAWLPLFLPYVALIDDPVLQQRCPPRRDDAPPFTTDPRDSDAEALRREAEATQRAQASADCLALLWQVSIDGRVVALDGFVASERADLGLRGLSGYLPLNGLVPGPHTLEVIRRPRPEQDPLTEDYVPRRTRYVIPFLWSPDTAVVLPAASAAPVGEETPG